MIACWGLPFSLQRQLRVTLKVPYTKEHEEHIGHGPSLVTREGVRSLQLPPPLQGQCCKHVQDYKSFCLPK